MRGGSAWLSEFPASDTDRHGARAAVGQGKRTKRPMLIAADMPGRSHAEHYAPFASFHSGAGCIELEAVEYVDENVSEMGPSDRCKARKTPSNPYQSGTLRKYPVRVRTARTDAGVDAGCESKVMGNADI